MSEKADKAFAEAQANPGTTVDIGKMVLCDFCNVDYTGLPDTGGIIWGSYAICPRCHREGGPYSEHRIKATCTPGMRFADFVWEYRETHGGHGITVREYKTVDELAKAVPANQVSIQALKDELSKDLSPEFMVSCDHPYDCRCASCLSWWAQMGPDEDSEDYGPFTKDEVNAEQRRLNLEVT